MSVNGQTPDSAGDIDLDYKVDPVSGVGNGVTNVTNDFLTALNGAAPQVDFTGDSDLNIAGGATLRGTGVGPGKFVSRAYPFGGSEDLVTHVHITAAFHAVTSTFLSLALFRPDGTTIPLASPAGSGLGAGWDPSSVDIRFFGTGVESIDIDVFLAVPEQFDEDDIQLGIAEASFAAGDPVTLTVSGAWHSNVEESVDRFADHAVLAGELGQLPVTTFFAKFGPFADLDMSASGDGSYAKSVGDMTDSRGGSHWTVVEGDGFWLYNQGGTNPDHNGRYTFHRPPSGDCYFTYDPTQPSLPGTLVVMEQGGDPIPGLDPDDMEQGGTVPGTGLEQQVLYYIRDISRRADGSIGGFNTNQLLPNPSWMWTAIGAGDTNFSDSEQVRFMDPTDGDCHHHMRAADFSDGANVVQRLFWFTCKAGTGNHAYLEDHNIEGESPVEVPAGGGLILYSDGTAWRVLVRWQPSEVPDSTEVNSAWVLIPDGSGGASWSYMPFDPTGTTYGTLAPTGVPPTYSIMQDAVMELYNRLHAALVPGF